MEKKYVSNIITEKVIEELKQGGNYLIGSEMGSGKNYWMRHILLQFAIENSKRVLIVAHRTAIKEQQYAYLRDLQDECMRAFKADTFKIKSYQELENIIKKKEFFKLDKYDYIICDECHYLTKDSDMSPKTAYSYEWLNNNNIAIKIFLTGTYDSFSYLSWKTPMKQLKYADYYNNNIDELYFYKNREYLKPMIEEKIVNGEKVLMIVGDKNIGSNFKSNVNAKSYFITTNNKSSKEFLSIVENNTFTSDLLVSTSLICEGVEIKNTEVKTVIVDGIDDLELIAQSPARIRDKNVILFINKPSHQKIINRYIKCRDLLERIEEFEELGYIEYAETYGYETIERSHKFLITETVINHETQRKELILKLNPCAVANIQYHFDMYEKIMEVGFEKALSEYFPNVIGYNYDELIKQDVITQSILEDFLDRRLFKEEQEKLKGLLLREYNFKKTSLSSINKQFEEKNIAYKINSKRVKVNNELNTVWILERV